MGVNNERVDIEGYEGLGGENMAEWKPIKNYENHYLVSDDGQVKSIDRIVEYENNGVIRSYLKKGRILKPIKLGNYQGVQLSVNGNKKNTYIHRLVAKHFIPNEHDLETVNHIDGNKNNNHVSNLEWLSQKDNNAHARKTGLSNFDADNNPMAKFNWEKVNSLRKDYASGKYKQSELATRYGISRMQTSRIVRNLAWRV